MFEVVVCARRRKQIPASSPRRGAAIQAANGRRGYEKPATDARPHFGAGGRGVNEAADVDATAGAVGQKRPLTVELDQQPVEPAAMLLQSDDKASDKAKSKASRNH